MKKYGKYFAILSVLAALCFTGCSDLSIQDNNLNEDQNITEQKNGDVSVSMFIPDYRAIATSRAIAPQTKYARLKIKSSYGKYFGNEIISEIKDEDLTDVEGGSEAGLPGKIWKAKFSVPLGTYSVGKLMVELLDADKNVITSGSNSTEVKVSESTSGTCSFFTVPQSAENNKGSLALNEMKFFKVSNPLVGEKIRAVEAELNGGIVIRFNKDGTFGEVLSGFAKDTEFDVTDKTVGSYYGIWAKDNAVDSYSVRLYLSRNIVTADSPIIEEFNDNLDLNIWHLNGYEAGDTVSPESAKTTNTRTYEHENANSIKFGNLTKNVYVSQSSAVTFSFYPDSKSSYGTVSFFINNEKKGAWQGKGLRQTYTFTLPEAGEYELKWISTASYLDKVSIVADVVKGVEITPKGMQTVIAGQEYTFTANALREDGSVIEGKSVTETKTFTGTGKQTFNMEVDGISAEATVNVIADDITSPVELMGKTYSGITSEPTGSVANQCPNKDYKKLEVTYPTGNSFEADGFFPLKLKVNNPDNNQFIAVSVSGGNHSEEESYVYRGNPTTTEGELETRIWLRWGKGTYTVKVYDAVTVGWNYSKVDGTKSDDGSVTYYGDNVASVTRYTDNPSVTFTVNNTRDEDGTYLYPSNVIQCDDVAIMNKAADLTAGLTDTNAKIKAIHDWIVTSKFYDYDSLNGARKRQDAVAVMEYGMCVCEGYANLTAALLRNCGIQVKFISSTSLIHGWNEVNVGTSESPDWRLLDSTWDDPTLNGTTDGGPYFVSYDNYLLEDLQGGSRAHTGGSELVSRAVRPSYGHIGGVENTAY